MEASVCGHTGLGATGLVDGSGITLALYNSIKSYVLLEQRLAWRKPIKRGGKGIRGWGGKRDGNREEEGRIGKKTKRKAIVGKVRHVKARQENERRREGKESKAMVGKE